MKTSAAVAALIACLTVVSARADDKSNAAAAPAAAPSAHESIMTFFKNLKNSLAQSAVATERKKNRVGSVAAVRGAGQYSNLSDPNTPTLKDDAKAKRAKAQMAEDAELEKAVDMILKGDTDNGIKSLDAFKAKHPKSHSLAKVEEALGQAKSLKDSEKPAKAP